MTTETMTIHRALVELKTIDARISKEIRSASFCTSAKHGTKKIEGVAVDDYVGAATAAMDKITDLINRRNAIKSAVSKSNAVTVVTVGDKTYTVAEAIAMKQHGMSLWEDLLNRLRMQYTSAISNIEANNSLLDDKADRFVTETYGGKDSSKDVDPQIISAARQAYIESRQYDMYDGLSKKEGRFKSVKEAIETIENMISTFDNEVDAALSVSNATTTIEINY